MKREGTLPASEGIQAGRREQQQRPAFHNFQSECASFLFSAFKAAGVPHPWRGASPHPWRGASLQRFTKAERGCLGRLFPLLTVLKRHQIFTGALLGGIPAR